MSDQNTGPREGIKGIVEDAKGKAKEAAGIVTGKNDLESEGRAQQEKAESHREAAQKEAEAEKARADANVDEARQRSHQQDG